MKLDLQNDLYFREKYLRRLRDFYHETELIKVITGVRRCGKSSLLQTVIRELLNQGIDENNIFYFNLDKHEYINIKNKDDLDKLIVDNVKGKGKKYLFIDEIQNVSDFEIVVNAWREEGDISIFITGSNSYLLSGELVTKLTGRYIEIDMYTLTFEEYLEMKEFLGIELSDNLDELTNYIYDGGFPFSLKLRTTDAKLEYTRNLVEEIIEKDIKSRITIRNNIAFEAIMKYFISNFGVPTNITNIVDDLKKRGVSIKIETANKYIEALENAKILIHCDQFDIRSRKSIMGNKKYYLSDLSFYYAINTDNRINYGPVLENIIHNYALTNGYKISVGRFGKLECDFILRDNNMNYAYVQVAYTILSSKDTEDREYRPLEMKTGDNYPRYVMTTDKFLQKRNGIKHVNITDFMKSKCRF